MKTLKKSAAITCILTLCFLFTQTDTVSAQITNPAIGAELGGDATTASNGYIFAVYFVRIWNSLGTVGALLVLGFFIMGAFDWLTSAGEKGKLESARNKMMNAVIGLIILVSLYTIIGVISDLFFGTNFNILNPTFISNL